jgi:hypothetical protein
LNTKLGIAFSGNKIFFSELVSENEAVRLVNIETAIIDFDFEDSFHSISQPEGPYKYCRRDPGCVKSVVSRCNQLIPGIYAILPLDYWKANN